jgi:choline dehydrogenase-like flavoprotein
MSARFDLDDQDVAVIIGSGAGGGTLAYELAKLGVKSIILEAGRPITLADIDNDEVGMAIKVGWLDKRLPGAVVSPPQSMPYMAKAVGGTTILWGGVAARFLPHDFRVRSTYGSVPGANLLDWPIGLPELEPYYVLAEKKLGVVGTAASGLPPLPENNHYKVLAAGARKIGYSQIVRPLAINSEVYGGRPPCQQIGFCQSGCRIGAKWSTFNTEIPSALASGKTELRAGSMALRIEHDAKGRISGVVYLDDHGQRHLQKARIVCVAGNSVESPRLLLNSESNQFPHGLANSSGQVGRNYMTHTSAFSFAVYEKPVYMYRGTTLSAIIADEVAPNSTRGFFGGYHLEGLSLGLPFTASNLNPGGWGREMTAALDAYDNMSLIWICGEDLPLQKNGVTLHPTEKDLFGLAAPVITKSDHPNDAAMRQHAWRQARKVAEAVGATKIFDSNPTGYGHNMGTNRMSAQARDGVVNQWGQSHDIKNLFISDGSQFTSSSAANPTLTIVALAIRQAEFIARSAKNGALKSA